MESLITSPASAGPMFQLKMKVYLCVCYTLHSQSLGVLTSEVCVFGRQIFCFIGSA